MKNLLFVVLLIVPSVLMAQFEVDNLKTFEKIRDGKTYLLVHNADAPEAKPYIEAISDAWELTDLYIVDLTKSSLPLESNSSYLSLSWIMKTSSDGGVTTHMSYEFYTLEEDAHDPEKTSIKASDRITLFRVEMHPTFQVAMNPQRTDTMDLSFEDSFRNWSPGLAKTYVKVCQNMILNEQERTRWKYYVNKEKVSGIANHPLLVPDYVLNSFNAFSGDESSRNEEEKVFKKYTYPYELLDKRALSDQLLKATDETYLFLYVKSSTDKHLAAINAGTGEVLYTEYKPMSYNLKSKDFKALLYCLENY